MIHSSCRWRTLLFYLCLILSDLVLPICSTHIQSEVVSYEKVGSTLIQKRTLTIVCDSNGPGLQDLTIEGQGIVRVNCGTPSILLQKEWFATGVEQVKLGAAQMCVATSTTDFSTQQFLSNGTNSSQDVNFSPFRRKLLTNTEDLAPPQQLPRSRSTYETAVNAGAAVICFFWGGCKKNGLSDDQVKAWQRQLGALDSWQQGLTTWANGIQQWETDIVSYEGVVQNQLNTLQDRVTVMQNSQTQINNALASSNQFTNSKFTDLFAETGLVGSQITATADALESYQSSVFFSVMQVINNQSQRIVNVMNNNSQQDYLNFIRARETIREMTRIQRSALKIMLDTHTQRQFVIEQAANIWQVLDQFQNDGLIPLLDPSNPGVPAPADISEVDTSLRNLLIDELFINYIDNTDNIVSDQITFMCDTKFVLDNVRSYHNWKDIIEWIGPCNLTDYSASRTCQCWVQHTRSQCQWNTANNPPYVWQKDQQHIINQATMCNDPAHTFFSQSFTYFNLSDWHLQLGQICSVINAPNAPSLQRVYSTRLLTFIDIQLPSSMNRLDICQINLQQVLEKPDTLGILNLIYSVYTDWKVSFDLLRSNVTAYTQYEQAIYGSIPGGVYQTRQDYVVTKNGNIGVCDFLFVLGHNGVAVPFFTLSEIKREAFAQVTTVLAVTNQTLNTVYKGDSIIMPDDYLIPSPFHYAGDINPIVDTFIYDVPVDAFTTGGNPFASQNTVSYYSSVAPKNLSFPGGQGAPWPAPLTLPQWIQIYGPFWDPRDAAVSVDFYKREVFPIGLNDTNQFRCSGPIGSMNELCRFYDKFVFKLAESTTDIMQVQPINWEYIIEVEVPEGTITQSPLSECPTISQKVYNDGTVLLFLKNSLTDSITFSFVQATLNCGTSAPIIMTLAGGETRKMELANCGNNQIEVQAFKLDLQSLAHGYTIPCSNPLLLNVANPTSIDVSPQDNLIVVSQTVQSQTTLDTMALISSLTRFLYSFLPFSSPEYLFTFFVDQTSYQNLWVSWENTSLTNLKINYVNVVANRTNVTFPSSVQDRLDIVANNSLLADAYRAQYENESAVAAADRAELEVLSANITATFELVQKESDALTAADADLVDELAKGPHGCGPCWEGMFICFTGLPAFGDIFNMILNVEIYMIGVLGAIFYIRWVLKRSSFFARRKTKRAKLANKKLSSQLKQQSFKSKAKVNAKDKPTKPKAKIKPFEMESSST